MANRVPRRQRRGADDGANLRRVLMLRALIDILPIPALGKSVLLLFVLGLAGCVLWDIGNSVFQGGYEPQINLSAQPSQASNLGTVQGNGTQVVYFDDSGETHSVPPGVQSDGQGYTVNLQSVSVDTAAQPLLADILQVPYSMDPNVTGEPPRVCRRPST